MHTLSTALDASSLTKVSFRGSHAHQPPNAVSCVILVIDPQTLNLFAFATPERRAYNA